MKHLVSAIALIILIVSVSKADVIPPVKKKVFTKSDISSLSEAYVNNNLNVKKPVIIDVDEDGDFDMLKFAAKGNVEYYKNTGTLENPVFVLEDKNFDNYEVNSFMPTMMVPVFFADRDGDNDVDVFPVIKEDSKYEVMYIENTMDVTNYTLITIILVLLIVALLVVIIR